MVVGVFSFLQSLKEIPSINLRTNLGVSISLGLFLLYLVAVCLGTWADNRRPKSKLKRPANIPNSQSSRRPEPYLVAPDEFKEFKEDPDESAEVEKKP
jgi:hypothetical protein